VIQFIGVLTKAHESSSPEYARLIKHVQSRPLPTPAPAPRTRATRPTYSTCPSFLTKVTNADGTYIYVPSHPPSRYAHWIDRRTPRLAKTEDETFIRFRKPQPAFLHKKLRKKVKIKLRDIDRTKAYEGETMASASEEDQWEYIVARQMKEEGLRDVEQQNDPHTSYRWSIALSLQWFRLRYERSQYDSAARGAGHQAFLDEVRRVQERPQALPTTATTQGPRPEHRLSVVKAVGGKKTHPLLVTIQKLTGQRPTGSEVDPFAEPYWASLVEEQDPHLLRSIPPLHLPHLPNCR